MHPITLTTYGRTVVYSRTSRRRARRAVIAVVVGLIAGGSGQAFADPPQYQSEQPHLAGSHANVHMYASPPLSPDRGGSAGFDWPIVILVSALPSAALVIVHRRRRLQPAT